MLDLFIKQVRAVSFLSHWLIIFTFFLLTIFYLNCTYFLTFFLDKLIIGEYILVQDWRISVKDIVSNFGENAGKIWQAMDQRGSLTKEELLEITQLNENELHAGLGWLARENKIRLDGENSYRLDSTNLTAEVGRNAGKVYKVLDIWGDVDPPILQKLVGADEKEIYSALGWLAREDKICTDEKSKINLK